MRELKPLSRDAVDAALAKAERYRFLNEPGEAESICLDILAVDAAQSGRAHHAAARAHRSVRRRCRRAPAGARGPRGARKRIRQGVLRRDHRRAARQGAARARRRRLERRGLRLDRRSDAAFRTRRMAAPVGQRRCAAAVERLRPVPRPPSAAPPRGRGAPRDRDARVDPGSSEACHASSPAVDDRRAARDRVGANRPAHRQAAAARPALGGHHRQAARRHRRRDDLPEGRQRRRCGVRHARRRRHDVGHARLGRRDAGAHLQPEDEEGHRHQRPRRRADRRHARSSIARRACSIRRSSVRSPPSRRARPAGCW